MNQTEQHFNESGNLILKFYKAVEMRCPIKLGRTGKSVY
jgi:hypothetical protein